MNKKLTATFSLIGLTTATFLSLSAVNKAIDKLAVSKNLLDDKKKEIYHWRFGDIRYSVTGDGKPVFLVHNLKEDSSSVEWAEIIPKLSRTATILS